MREGERGIGRGRGGRTRRAWCSRPHSRCMLPPPAQPCPSAITTSLHPPPLPPPHTRSRHPAVGTSPDDRATLAEPVSGSLVLAGEHTSVPYPATVHGALLAGQEAAARVLAAAALPPNCGDLVGCTLATAGACAADCLAG